MRPDESRVVDAHTHAFPDVDSGRAWQGSAEPPKRSGAIDELSALMLQGGIDQAVVLLFHRTAEAYERGLSVGLSPKAARLEARRSMREYNEWGLQLAQSDRRFIAFIGINPRFLSAAEIASDIASAVSGGARGVKIVPPRIGVYGNDRLLWPVYQACVDHDVPLLSQSGKGRELQKNGQDAFGRPKYFADVLSAFPHLKLILAHMGRGYDDDVSELTRRFENVYTDTSLRLSGLGKPGQWTGEDLVSSIRQIGVERVLFGSNYPYVNPAVYASILAALPLTDVEREMIAAGNFDRLMSN